MQEPARPDLGPTCSPRTAVIESLALTTAPLILIGHTHVPLAIRGAGRSVVGGLAPGGYEVPLEGKRWVLNPGSVGQPRDGDPEPPGC